MSFSSAFAHHTKHINSISSKLLKFKQISQYMSFFQRFFTTYINSILGKLLKFKQISQYMSFFQWFCTTYQTYQFYFKPTFEIFPLQHIFNSEPQRLGTIDARILICVNFNLHITTTRELNHKSALHWTINSTNEYNWTAYRMTLSYIPHICTKL